MNNSKEIIKAIENGDYIVLPITQDDLVELDWYFEDEDQFDRFCIEMINGKIRLIGERKTEYNPGYGVDNHGQKWNYDEGTVIAKGKEQFGGEEGLKEFWDKVDANLVLEE